MGTQGPGRKRIPNREKLTAEDDALNQIAREAEARLAAKRAARAEAREIRMKELERQQKEMSDDEERMSVGSRGSFRVEERPDRDFTEKGSRTASTLSAATLASLGGASSRRGSCDTSFSVETEASIRDMKDSLAEAEEKYRKAMVSNAQLHNEKTTLMYQTETLKEELSHMEELLWESRRHCDDRSKELERERQAHSVLQFQFKEMKETLTHSEELLKKHGVFVSPEISTNGDAEQGESEDESAAQLAQESSHGGRESMLGKVKEKQQPEQEDMKYDRFQTYRCSRSPNVAYSREQTRTDSLKQVKRAEKWVRTEKLTGRTKSLRKPRNKRSKKDLIKKPKIRQDGNELSQKQINKGSCVQTCEPKSAISGSHVDEACEGTTKPSSESGGLESSALSALIPAETLGDWCHLEKRVLTMMRGFVEKQVFTSELSKVVGSLHQWISDLEETLKMFAENVSQKSHTVDWTGQMMSIKVTRKDEHLKDFLGDIFKKRADRKAARHSVDIEDRSESQMIKGASLEVYPQTSGVSVDPKEVYEVQYSSASEGQQDAEETSDTISIIPNFILEVIQLSPEEKTRVNYEDIEEMQSQSDPKLTSCSEEFVFVESFLSEAAETKMESGKGSVSSQSQKEEVVSESHGQRTFGHRGQSCDPVVESQLKYVQMLSMNPPAAQRSKVRQLLETTAHEIRAMALPELVLYLHEGQTSEEQRLDESTGSNTDDVEELSVTDVDSCEEADEKAEQQPETEGVSEDVEVIPGVSSEKHWRGRKELRVASSKHKPDCKIS